MGEGGGGMTSVTVHVGEHVEAHGQPAHTLHIGMRRRGSYPPQDAMPPPPFPLPLLHWASVFCGSECGKRVY